MRLNVVPIYKAARLMGIPLARPSNTTSLQITSIARTFATTPTALWYNGSSHIVATEERHDEYTYE
jgi:hypothetical protein